MRFIIYSAHHLCQWDWTASGGSEQYHIELCERLARRGHEVISYAPVPWKVLRPRTHNGVTWDHFERADTSLEGAWIIQRDPDIVYAFPEDHPEQTLFCAIHDWDYIVAHGGKQLPWAEKFDAVLCESNSHAGFLRDKYPTANFVVTGAGFPMERIHQVPAATRNPKRLMYSSSPTRGLIHLLRIFQRAREEVSDLELYITYGWESIDAAIDGGYEPEKLRRLKRKVDALCQQPGVHWLGRLPSTFDVWCEYMKTGIFCYPSQFHEVMCNTVCEAQCFGAIPIVNPTWAVGDNTLHGIRVYGDPWDDRLTWCKFVREIVWLAQHPEVQDAMRPRMMADARERFDFDATVQRIEQIASYYHDKPSGKPPDVLVNSVVASDGGWLTDHNKAILSRLIMEHNVKTVLEIGSFLGGSTCWFARRVDHVWCVDRWEETETEPTVNNLVTALKKNRLGRDFYDTFCEVVTRSGLSDKITPVRGNSRDVSNLIPEVDLVFVAGDHSREGCASDIRLYLPKARKVICGDDYAPYAGVPAEKQSASLWGVKPAVNDLLPDHVNDENFWWHTVESQCVRAKSSAPASI